MDYSRFPALADAQPAVVFANRYQFAPGERRTNRAVGSRAVIWGVRGSGTVRSSGRRIELTPEVVMVLPWHHDVAYEADEHDPFLVAAMHIVPWHDPDVPIEPRAAHGRDDPLHRTRARRGEPWPEPDGVKTLRGRSTNTITQLGAAAVTFFLNDDLDEAVMRAFGTLALREMYRLSTEPGAASSSATTVSAMSAMTDYIRSHLAEPLTSEAIAAVAGISVSTAERTFRRETDGTLQAWVRAARLRHAARLLRTSNLRIGEVATQAGFRDPLYFSRVFRAGYGQSPRQYRTATAAL